MRNKGKRGQTDPAAPTLNKTRKLFLSLSGTTLSKEITLLHASFSCFR